MQFKVNDIVVLTRRGERFFRRVADATPEYARLAGEPCRYNQTTGCATTNSELLTARIALLTEADASELRKLQLAEKIHKLGVDQLMKVGLIRLRKVAELLGLDDE